MRSVKSNGVLAQGSQIMELPVTDLSSGTYIVLMRKNGTIVSKLLIIE
jgi:hypothetical protein